MRLKLCPSLAFDPHTDASNLRDNTGECWVYVKKKLTCGEPSSFFYLVHPCIPIFLPSSYTYFNKKFHYLMLCARTYFLGHSAWYANVEFAEDLPVQDNPIVNFRCPFKDWRNILQVHILPVIVLKEFRIPLWPGCLLIFSILLFKIPFVRLFLRRLLQTCPLRPAGTRRRIIRFLLRLSFREIRFFFLRDSITTCSALI
jgi:hypothetical protein